MRGVGKGCTRTHAAYAGGGAAVDVDGTADGDVALYRGWDYGSAGEWVRRDGFGDYWEVFVGFRGCTKANTEILASPE